MGTRVIYAGLFTPDASTVELSKPEIVRWLLGSHEYLLQCIEAWATQITVRYGLDVMFDIQWTLWGDSVLPGVKKLKAEYLGITGNTVADWMKDLQTDATAMPGKAFDVSFEMPEPDVGIMQFNRCVAATSGRPWDGPTSSQKNCHSTCPKSMIVTTKMYNPNMKVDILAIPPRKDPGNVCCKWRFSMRTPDDPEYVKDPDRHARPRLTRGGDSMIGGSLSDGGASTTAASSASPLRWEDDHTTFEHPSVHTISWTLIVPLLLATVARTGGGVQRPGAAGDVESPGWDGPVQSWSTSAVRLHLRHRPTMAHTPSRQ